MYYVVSMYVKVITLISRDEVEKLYKSVTKKNGVFSQEINKRGWGNLYEEVGQYEKTNKRDPSFNI